VGMIAVSDMSDEYTGPIPDHLRSMFERVDELIWSGATIHFKWTCAKCGARQTFEEANKFYKSGRCEECSSVTDLFHHSTQVGYLLVMELGGKPTLPN